MRVLAFMRFLVRLVAILVALHTICNNGVDRVVEKSGYQHRAAL